MEENKAIAQRCIIRPTSVIDTTNVYNAWFNHGHKENAGEDANPFILCSKTNEHGAMGVFDGMGGAGSRMSHAEDGTPHTEAYLASRFVRERVMEFVKKYKKVDNEIDKDKLSSHIKICLDSYKEHLKIKPSLLKSSMIRTLPTTMAMTIWDVNEDGLRINSYWAGDSRNYILCSDGLMQITEDDVRNGGDAMFNLHNDPPMSNTISQSNPFVINNIKVSSDTPVILISCTDGCFGYVMSPMHFEKMLLDTLFMSNDIKEWRDNIHNALLPISGDDYSFAITMIGMSFDDWKKELKSRYTILVSKYTRPYEILTTEIKDIPEQLDIIWEKYKACYEKIITKEPSLEEYGC